MAGGSGIVGGIRATGAAASSDAIARSAGRRGLLGLAAVGGWNIGTYLYHETPVRDWVSKGIDKTIGLDQ